MNFLLCNFSSFCKGCVFLQGLSTSLNKPTGVYFSLFGQVKVPAGVLEEEGGQDLEFVLHRESTRGSWASAAQK